MNLVHLIDVEKLTSQLTKVSLPKTGAALAASFLLATGVTWYSGYYLIGQRDSKIGVSATRVIPGLAENSTNRARESLTPAETDRILKRNIFNSEGKLGDVEAEDAPLEKSIKPVKSDLPLRLLGVIFGGNPYNGLALIENKEKNRTNSFVVGEVVDRGANLIEIYPDRIILERQGRKEFIMIEVAELQRSRRVRKNATPNRNTAILAAGTVGDNYKEEGFERKGNDIVISETYKRNLLSDKMTDVLQDAKAEPNMVGSELKGFRLVRIREGSIYQKAGFQNNDVVLEINGIPLKDAAGAIQLLNSLRQAKQIDVLVERGGASFLQNITVQ